MATVCTAITNPPAVNYRVLCVHYRAQAPTMCLKNDEIFECMQDAIVKPFPSLQEISLREKKFLFVENPVVRDQIASLQKRRNWKRACEPSPKRMHS